MKGMVIQINDYKRLEGETEEELIYRICNNKDTIGSWQEVANTLNSILNYEYTESKYRKQFQAFQKMMNANQSKFVDDDTYLSEIRVQRQELEKEKVKMRDERNELSRIIREQARKESFVDMAKRIISEIEPKELEYEYIKTEKGNNDLIIHLTDIHAGIFIDNFFNVFNMDVLIDRLKKYLDKIYEIKERHNSENCYLVLGGDLISGIIHSTLRIENNENVIAQIKMVSSYISDFTSELSKVFNNVNVYTTAGNHSRVIANKNESLKGENLDTLIPFYMEAKLQNYKNVKIFNNEVEESIAIFNVRGNVVNATHGDKDAVSNVVQRFTMMFGIKPKIILMGHRHTNGMTTIFDTKVIESGSVSGNDNYCLDHRLIGKPEQMVLVVDKDGIDCLYDIQL